MAASLPFAEVLLSENDVPGAKFTETNVADHTVVQLKRWLQCRGLSTKGTKSELIERCHECIASGRHHDISNNVDGGLILSLKVAASRSKVLQNIQDKPPLFPCLGWKPFPSQEIPASFSYGSIYHHLVQSAIFASRNGSNSEDSENTPKGFIDVHTAKPLQKGRIYFKSGNVLQMEDCSCNNFYYLRSKVMASYQAEIKYPVLVMLDKLTGRVSDASCECKASSMGRCNHVAAVLFALEDYTILFGYKPPACTSLICEWNKGRKKKEPSTISAKPYSMKKDFIARFNFDPRPPTARKRSNEEILMNTNKFQQNLQIFSQTKDLQVSMWEQILTFHYEDYELSSERQEVLLSNVDIFNSNLNSNYNFPTSIPGTETQSDSESWRNFRSWFITASVCKEFSVEKKTQLSTYSLLERHLWRKELVLTLPSLVYGKVNESIAIEQYRETFDMIVQGTGLWINPEKPGLAASPDGLVQDPRTKEHGILEVKCPFVLKEFSPQELNRLTKNQQRNICYTIENGNIKLKRNHKYYYQVQMQMAVTSIVWCDFVVWSPKGILRERIKFSEEFWAPVEERLSKFYRFVFVPEIFEQNSEKTATISFIYEWTMIQINQMCNLFYIDIFGCFTITIKIQCTFLIHVR